MRSICLFLLVVVLVGVGAAWGFHWWNISAAPNGDNGKTEVRLTIDKDKVRHDVGAAEDKIKEGVHGLKPGHQDQDKALTPGKTLAGTIRTIDAGNHSLTVMSEGNEEVTVPTDAGTRIRIGDKEATLADLKIGDRTTVTYESDNRDKPAKTVTVEKRS
jgi:hypothetical protein